MTITTTRPAGVPPPRDLDRLTGQDRWMLAPDEYGWPQDIGAVAIVDGRSVLDDTGSVRIDAVRDHIGRRLLCAPKLRKIVYRPARGLGGPLWVDAPSFDVADHVHTWPLEPSADEPQLLRACEQLRRQRWDPSRPPWGLWLLPGLPGGRLGVYVRMHHVIADGVAGVATIGALLDLAPDSSPPTPPEWVPAPIPSDEALRADLVRRRRRAMRRAARSTISGLRHPRPVMRSARNIGAQFHDVFGDRAPDTSLNRPIGQERMLALVRARLEPIREAAHAHGGKVNDVVLAAVAGGLRELLHARGEAVDDLVLRAAVPVSLHRDVGTEPANMDAAMAVPLPIGEPDPIRRLELIGAETARRKPRAATNPFSFVMGTRRGQRAFLRAYPRQRLVNVYLANVPGPAVPMYLAGMPLLEVFPVVPLGGNITVGVGVLSYAGQLNLTVVADRDACPDIAVFTAGLRDGLDAMVTAGCGPAKRRCSPYPAQSPQARLAQGHM